MIFILSVAFLSLYFIHITPKSWTQLQTDEKEKPPQCPVDVSLSLELIATMMKTGCSLLRSLDLVTKTLDTEDQQALSHVLTMLNLGSTWEQAWSHTDGELKELGNSLETANQGISSHKILHGKAKAYRKNKHASMLEKIEALSIKLLMPLGLLALPAFIAIGIVPTIICLLHTVNF